MRPPPPAPPIADDGASPPAIPGDPAEIVDDRHGREAVSVERGTDATLEEEAGGDPRGGDDVERGDGGASIPDEPQTDDDREQRGNSGP